MLEKNYLPVVIRADVFTITLGDLYNQWLYQWEMSEQSGACSTSSI